jgi:hypothetical protein
MYVLRDVLESKIRNGPQGRRQVIRVKAGTLRTGPIACQNPLVARWSCFYQI